MYSTISLGGRFMKGVKTVGESSSSQPKDGCLKGVLFKALYWSLKRDFSRNSTPYAFDPVVGNTF